MRDLVDLDEGDIIPIEIPNMVSIKAQGVPIVKGRFGPSNGKNAIQVVERINVKPGGLSS